MRAVLALALVLLGLTVGLNQARWLASSKTGSGLADRALEILVGAKGPLLASARIGSGPERIAEAMRIGDRTLVGDGREGLRAAFVGPDFELRAERCFDVAHSRADAEALRKAVEAASDGEVLVLASSGRLEPSDDVAGMELSRALQHLGARATPGTTTPESWAMIALRLERRWVPLAEGYSTESGVALAFVLAPDLERYAAFEGDFALVRAPARREIFLEDELRHASSRTAGVTLVRDRSVQGQPLAGILLPPEVSADGSARPGRLVWNDVKLGQGSYFVALVGLADRLAEGLAEGESDGVTFEVRIGGELAVSQPVSSGARWKSMQVDLSRFAGRQAALELVVDPRQNAVGDAALWGRPALVHGYERAPLQAWIEER